MFYTYRQMILTFGQWLSTEMQARFWDEPEMARRAGITKQAVNALVNDKVNEPKAATLARIAKALGVPLEEVLVAAGIITAKPDKDPRVERAAYLLETGLDDDQIDQALQIIEMLATTRGHAQKRRRSQDSGKT